MSVNSLQELITASEGASLIAYCEDCELQGLVSEDVTIADVYVCLLLQLLAENKVTRAELAALRAVRNLSAHHTTPEVIAVLQLVKAMGKRDYTVTNTAFDTLNAQLRPEFGVLRDRLVAKYRQRQLALIADAYVQVGVARAAVLLGTNAEDCKRAAESQGWTYDASADMLFPTVEVLKVQPAAASDVKEQLKQLSEYVVHLEI